MQGIQSKDICAFIFPDLLNLEDKKTYCTSHQYVHNLTLGGKIFIKIVVEDIYINLSVNNLATKSWRFSLKEIYLYLFLFYFLNCAVIEVVKKPTDFFQPSTIRRSSYTGRGGRPFVLCRLMPDTQ